MFVLGGGETPRFLRAFPFAIKACLSWEIQDRILLRERWKDRPSGASEGRAREGSGRSIERSSNQSVTGVNLELGEKKKKTMKATRCGGICPHGPDVITGVSHMAPRCDDAPSAKMVFAGGGFLHQHGVFSSYLPVRDDISSSRFKRCIPIWTARQKRRCVFTNRSVKVTKVLLSMLI